MNYINHQKEIKDHLEYLVRREFDGIPVVFENAINLSRMNRNKYIRHWAVASSDEEHFAEGVYRQFQWEIVIYFTRNGQDMSRMWDEFSKDVAKMNRLLHEYSCYNASGTTVWHNIQANYEIMEDITDIDEVDIEDVSLYIPAYFDLIIHRNCMEVEA